MAKPPAIPVYSTVRFSFDFSHTAAAGTKMFGEFGADSKLPTAFSYGLRDSNMKAAGFGTTRPGERYTNLTEAGRLPTGQQMLIQSIAIVPRGYLTKPRSTADAASCISDEDGDQFRVWDIFDGKLYSHALETLDECFSVSLVQGPPGSAGNTIRLPSISMLSAGRGFFDGRKNQIHGTPFGLGDVIPWRAEGDDQFLRVEFALKRVPTNAAWDNTAGAANTQYISDLAKALSVSNAAAAAGSLAWVANLDLRVVLFGARG